MFGNHLWWMLIDVPCTRIYYSLFQSQVLPFSFMGPVLKASKLPECFDNFFPSFAKENWGPVAFKGSYFDFGFMQKRIFLSLPPLETNDSIYITWLDLVESQK